MTWDSNYPLIFLHFKPIFVAFKYSGCQLGYYDFTSTVIANINANVRDFFKD